MMFRRNAARWPLLVSLCMLALATAVPTGATPPGMKGPPSHDVTGCVRGADLIMAEPQPGSGMISNRPGMGTLKVDGKAVDTKAMKRTVPMILQWDESFDIGSDTLTGVNDADYKPPFPLTAKFNKLTIKVDRPKLSPEDIKKLEEGMKQAADAK